MLFIKILSPYTAFIFITALLSSCSDQSSNPYSSGSYDHANQKLQVSLNQKHNTEKAEGIILFVGDGMSIATVTASRIYAGQKTGQPGEAHQLSCEKFP